MKLDIKKWINGLNGLMRFLVYDSLNGSLIKSRNSTDKKITINFYLKTISFLRLIG